MIESDKLKIVELLEEIGDIYDGHDWLIVKKYVLRHIHPQIRKNFSTRDSKTKKHIINSFEEKIISIYYEKFNVKLVLDDSKKL
tara:strand:- start:150 stop:401 length:252 start_codon:yes stop_codon:yes gene_type:complete